MPEDKITINNKEYAVSPLRMKHLKQITSMLAGPTPSGVYAGLERWFPFIIDAVKEKNPTFSLAELEEATMDEINTAWTAVVSHSGITIVTKSAGEQKPKEESTGPESTGASVPPSAGTTETSTPAL